MEYQHPPEIYVPIIPNESIQEHHMKNRPLYYKISITENIEGHKPQLFTKSHVKYKDALPSYQYISPRVSTEIDAKNQSDERPSQEY